MAVPQPLGEAQRLGETWLRPPSLEVEEPGLDLLTPPEDSCTPKSEGGRTTWEHTRPLFVQSHPGPDDIPLPYCFLFKIWSLEDGANSSPVSPPHRAELVSGAAEAAGCQAAPGKEAEGGRSPEARSGKRGMRNGTRPKEKQ